MINETIKINSNGISIKEECICDKISNNQVLLCIQWIKQNMIKSKGILLKKSSYNYKHLVEAYFDEYISNGAFIYAALKLGYDIKPTGLNAYFNMKKI